MSEMNPPKAAEAVVRQFLREHEIDPVTGDLLEEYRAAKRPALGKHGANVRYALQVLRVVGRVVWPGIVAVIGLRILSFPLSQGWNPSIVPSPGTSLLDAVILVWAAYHGAKRTGRVITGVLTSMVTACVGFASFFVYAVVTQPSLVMAPLTTPFVIVILCVLLIIAMTFAVVAGATGAAAGRWRHATMQSAG